MTGIGKVKEDELILSGGAKPGQDIVVTKYLGMEGTGIIANEKEDELKEWFSDTFIDDAKAFLDDISVVPEGLIARKYASCMHDITESGVYGALWEISKASGVGVEVCIEDIPLRQHTIEFCERYDLNPYQLISSGSMLITTDHGRTLVNELEQAGIKATIIGHTTDSRDKVIYRQGKAANLEHLDRTSYIKYILKIIADNFQREKWRKQYEHRIKRTDFKIDREKQSFSDP